ncbi:TPA: hypothetical protein ACX6Q7_001302 [Photobacterium damselae]
MKKGIIFIVFFAIKCFASYDDSLTFNMIAKIDTNSLFYKITEFELKPDQIELNFNTKNNTFDPVDINMQVKSNIVKGSLGYRYVLSIINEKSFCKDNDDVIERYKSPELSITINGKIIVLSHKPSLPIDFGSTYSLPGSTSLYLSDENIIHFKFFEPQSDKTIKDFKTCEGGVSLLAGLDI